MGFNELPPLPGVSESMAGPTPWCNWVIKGQVLAGAYPASTDDRETHKILSVLLERGMEVFVCLQAEVSLSIPEGMWRSGKGLRPYIKDAQRIMTQARDCGNTRILISKLNFLHLPIIDGSITTDSAISKLADDCCGRVLAGEKLYIHCWGGHGRTGTLVALMLSRLYKLSCNEALRLTQEFHDARKYPQNVRSPQTAIQRTQVRRILSAELLQNNTGAELINSPSKAVKAGLLATAAPRSVAAAVTRKTSALQRSVSDSPHRASQINSTPAQHRFTSPLRHGSSLRHSLLPNPTGSAYSPPQQLRPSGRLASNAAIAASGTPVRAQLNVLSQSNAPASPPRRAQSNVPQLNARTLSPGGIRASMPAAAAYASTDERSRQGRIAAIQGIQHQNMQQHQHASISSRLTKSLSSRDMPFAATASSSVQHYGKKVGEQLSEGLSSAWRRTSSNSSIRHLGEKLQSFKL